LGHGYFLTEANFGYGFSVNKNGIFRNYRRFDSQGERILFLKGRLDKGFRDHD
jgi:hypothetical protein